jgi:hypothetical protein
LKFSTFTRINERLDGEVIEERDEIHGGDLFSEEGSEELEVDS